MAVRDSSWQLEKVLTKAHHRRSLSMGEIRFLLGLRGEEETARLWEAARELRGRHFGRSLFLYGFIFFSTYCRNLCSFCLYRKSNGFAPRYRKARPQVVEVARRIAEAGVHLIDLTMGEDPCFHQDHRGFAELEQTVGAAKEATGLPLMVSPGVVPLAVLRKLAEAGADWYACYQETYHRGLFRGLRPGQSYERRLKIKKEARRLGILIEEGILTGFGDSASDLARSLKAMQALKAHQLRVMTFIPQQGTPLERLPSPSFSRELKAIAVLRLLFPDRLIPASLDIRGIEGLRDRLQAGANVITSLIPPCTGLSGVSQSTLDIDAGKRSPEKIRPVLEGMGLQVATREEYLQWVCREKNRLIAESRE